MRAQLAVGAAVATATTVVALVDPNQPGHYPTCPFLALTGVECPGCGGLRAVHALTQGEFGAAVAHNALVVAAIPLLVAFWMWWLMRETRRQRGPGRERSGRAVPAGRSGCG